MIYTSYYRQITFFSRDCRHCSLISNQPILKVQSLVNLNSVQDNNCSEQAEDKIILFENSLKYITAGQIVT